MSTPAQLSLVLTPKTAPTPRKAVRSVSRQQYAALRDTPGALSERTHAVLTAMAHRYYVTQDWATPAELTRWMFQHSRIPRESVNIVAPRISDLVNGAWVYDLDAEGRRVVGADGKPVRVQKGGGVCELLPKRVCAVTGGLAHPVRIREAGSILQQFGYGGKS